MLYDCEHGMIPFEKLHDLILMGNAIEIPSIVRVPELCRSEVSKALDCGATGVMVPMVETREEAMRMVDWSKYPPHGKRGYSGGANTGYKPSGGHKKNMEIINKGMISIAQVETTKGVENLESIVSVDGIDAIVVGPADLAISLGIPGEMANPLLIDHIRKIAKVTKSHQKAFGIIGGLPLLKQFKEELNIIINAIDTHILRDGFMKNVRELNQIFS